ncbi:MAG: multicopper oxidase domain-containing protein [Chloroflexi bacterium]|nr:multicopper oxidase domain-containing protein [Chloroflexota bacterium]
MFNHKFLKLLLLAIVAACLLLVGSDVTSAQKPPPRKKLVSVTQADREAAAKRAAAKGLKPGVSGKTTTSKPTNGKAPANAPAAVPPPVLEPGGVPHYFGPYANYANSPLPMGTITGLTLDSGGTGYTAPVVTIADVYGTGTGATASATVVGGVITALTLTNGGTGYSAPIVFIEDTTGVDAAATATIGGALGSLSGGIRKFVDSLPGAGAANANNLGQFIPIGEPDACTYSGQVADCYVIELREYTEKMHSDLPPTRLRGYVQVRNGVDVTPIHYLGPTIVAQRDRPVRITFRNRLPTGAGGNLFLPVDSTVMGAGEGPLDRIGLPGVKESFTQNRATLHLHGGLIPWISDGTAHQWTTPSGESTQYPSGVSVYNVPDMPNPGRTAAQGELTFYYNNEQSARLMFYHDHSFGITRLNVYAGEAAGYLITDQVEQDMINGTNVSGVNPGSARVLPDIGIPLIIQDRTFVDSATIAAQDPTWPFVPRSGDLWYPHVYMPNQNPGDLSGMNAFGRWHYTPWFWPPATNLTYGPVANPYYDCGVGQPCTRPWEPPLMPGTPNVSAATEAFMDTPIVNGTAYPYLVVDPKAVRFRILNAADDRFWNLQLYVADPTTVRAADGATNTEVKLAPAPAGVAGYPAGYMVADPTTAGPSFIQVGTEGGFLPKPVVLSNKPIGWNGDQTNFDVGIVNQGTLILGPAERADVIVDFSAFAGRTLILYNDSPAPFPALDVRYDYYTGKGDHTDTGGTPDTQPGYGPNTRTIMQIRVNNVTPAPTYNLATLNAVFADGADPKRGVFEVSQEPVIIPNTQYNSAYNRTFASEAVTKVGIADSSKTFQTISGASVTIPFEKKALHDEASEVYDEYGRMSGMLGLTGGAKGFITYPFPSPPVDLIRVSMVPMSEPSPGDGTQIWKITHNGVDTHPIHFHQFNVQLINRVAWDNATRLPDANELGWKETVRINPLQDTIVALRPVAPLNQPFRIPNSERVLDPSKAPGVTLMGPLPNGFQNPAGDPVTVVNDKVSLGWEHVYHCHILAHEEMDMMHSVSLVVPPDAPTGLSATQSNGSARLTWTDNSVTETRFTVQRAAASTGPWTTLSTLLSADRPGVGATVMFTDTTVVPNTPYFYQVLATNLVGSSLSSNFTLPAAPGFPTMNAESLPSNTVSVTIASSVAAPTNLVATLVGGPLRVRLTWMDNATNETGFRIERSVNGGAFTQIAAPGPRAGTGSASWTGNNLVVGNTYTYRVRAARVAGGTTSYSAYSNEVSIAVTAPAAPSGLTLTAARAGLLDSITMNWTDNATNETSFTVQCATNTTFTANRITINNIPANSTTYTRAGVPRGRTYYCRVRAVNPVDTSAWSNVASVTTP